MAQLNWKKYHDVAGHYLSSKWFFKGNQEREIWAEVIDEEDFSFGGFDRWTVYLVEPTSETNSGEKYIRNQNFKTMKLCKEWAQHIADNDFEAAGELVAEHNKLRNAWMNGEHLKSKQTKHEQVSGGCLMALLVPVAVAVILTALL